ncbi:phage baseplate protein [Chryseobacterium sp.]|uniref:phage baseplate protein n=1 Tax=Chryseobacterium sp. TaxID=1871047 RepID=UPI00289E050F|nr:hypothetical protein [Chryseobacterium sp.]
MGINIKFLQTGGLPLTNDLLNSLQSAYEIFNSMASLVGNLTIISGCEMIGSSVNPGVVAIDGEFYEFEGGSGSTVFINVDEQKEVFQDTINKVLIVKKTVRFGNALNTYLWSDFISLKTLKQMQYDMTGFATKSDVEALKEEVNLLKIKTAPIINGGVVWAWRKAEIPVGWKECIDLQGKVIVGLSPNESEFSTLGGEYGTKTHTLSVNEMPNHNHSIGNVGVVLSGKNHTNSGSFQAFQASNVGTSAIGGNQAHNNIQPSKILKFIEPNFQ